MTAYPLDLPSILFLMLVIGLSFGFVALVLRLCAEATAPRRRLVTFGAAAALASWLTFVGLLAWNGFFQVTDTIPPRFLLLLAPPLVAIVASLFSKRLAQAFDDVRPELLIGFQSFRIVMEWILHRLYRDGSIAALMTFEGRNFDILIGVTAPLAALYVAKRGPASRWVAIGWNLFGLALLLNVVVHGVLSAPTPLRMIITTPPNTFVLAWPYCWLPAFVVPCALAGHLYSLRYWIRASDRAS
ncbi:MAG: hypothetical protein KC609_17925 [Myxococcales bacterium]|nr:hypothetical protein [Myxococcales bacterium]